MILHQTVEKIVQQSDPVAWIQASETGRAKLVNDYHMKIQRDQAQISQQMAPPVMTGNYLEDVAAHKAQQRLAQELAMPSAPSEIELRDINRQFWTHWAKCNPNYVKPQVMRLLTRWEQIFDTSSYGTLGPQQWQENNPIYFEETTPHPLDEASLIDQWKQFTQPMIDTYLDELVMEQFFSLNNQMWDLTRPEITLTNLRAILTTMKRGNPQLAIAIEDINHTIAGLAQEVELFLMPEDTTPAWLVEYHRLRNGTPI